MRFTIFILFIAAKATQTTTSAQRIIKLQNKDKIIRALIDGNSKDDGVNPFIIGGETLDRTVWEESRRYLVSIRSHDSGLHSCGATNISDRVVLTAARKSNQYKNRNVFHSLCCYVFDKILNHPCPLHHVIHFSLLSRLLSRRRLQLFPKKNQFHLTGMLRMRKPELSRLICARLNSELDVMVLPMLCATLNMMESCYKRMSL